MNLSLLDPFTLTQEYPENIAAVLRSGFSTCIRFNDAGDLVASGRSDGIVVVFDLETNGLARILKSHTQQIQSLCWSKCSRYLLSSSRDWRVVLWDLETGERIKMVRFGAPIYYADLHPNNHMQFVAALFNDLPYYVDMTSSGSPKQYALPTAPKREDAEEDSEAVAKRAAQDSKMLTTAVIFSRDGRHIFAGTNKGWINILDTETKEVIYSTKLCNGAVTFLRLSPIGRDIMVNSTDRIIRTAHLPDFSDPNVTLSMPVEHKFQDVVNRLTWNHCTFSATGEYIAASTFHNHDIYIWERTKASLVKILEAPKEELGVVEWHPGKPMIAGVGIETGTVYIWSTSTHQRWSALAPDFTELEENVEYIEREDEFDIHPKEEVTKRKLHMEDEEVDVLGYRNETENRLGWILPVMGDLEDTESESEGRGGTPPGVIVEERGKKREPKGGQGKKRKK